MRSRGKIMEATLEVIAEHGFDGVTIAGVSAAAGVSRQTVYSIFGTREVLVTRTMEHLAVEVMTEIRSRLDGPETVRDYVVEMVIGGRRAVRDIPAMGALLRLDGINPVLHPDVVQHAIPVVRDLLSPLTALDPGSRRCWTTSSSSPLVSDCPSCSSTIRPSRTTTTSAPSSCGGSRRR